jgi:hypothetical protein
MGKPQVCKIYIIGGQPDNSKAHAKNADVIVWIPETKEDLIDIRFDDKSPFATKRLTADNKGDAVGAFVVADPKLDTEYPYSCTTNGVQTLAAEPEIIVDGGGGGPDPKGDGGGKKGRKTKGGGAKKR